MDDLEERDRILSELEEERKDDMDLVVDMGFYFMDMSLHELNSQVVRLYTGTGAGSWDDRLQDGWFTDKKTPGDDMEELFFTAEEDIARGYATDKYDSPAILQVEVPWGNLARGSGDEPGKVYSSDVKGTYQATSYPARWITGIRRAEEESFHQIEHVYEIDEVLDPGD